MCWCLSHRVDAKTNKALVGPERGEYVRRLTCRSRVAPAAADDDDDGDDVVGWAAVAPRAELPFARSQKIPARQRPAGVVGLVLPVSPGPPGPGHRARAARRRRRAPRGSTTHPALEGYPVDNRGAKVDLTMAYVGTRALFERAGFEKVADTDSVTAGFPRVVMRRAL